MPVVLRGQDAGRTLPYLLSALDGEQTLDDLLSRCPKDVPQDSLLKTLILLHTRGLLTTGKKAPDWIGSLDSDAPLGRQMLLWGRSLGFTGYASWPEEVQHRIETARILLVATAVLGAATYDLLASSGCRGVKVIGWDDDGTLVQAVASHRTVPADVVQLPTTSLDDLASAMRRMSAEVDLVVMAVRNAPSKLFRIANRICLDNDCPLLCAHDDGQTIDLGPFIRPYGSACYHCLELRQASTRDHELEEQLYQAHLAEERPAGAVFLRGESLAGASLAASLITLEVIRSVTGIAPPALLNAVQTISPIEARFEMHRFVRVPRCPECYRGQTLPPRNDPSRE